MIGAAAAFGPSRNSTRASLPDATRSGQSAALDEAQTTACLLFPSPPLNASEQLNECDLKHVRDGFEHQDGHVSLTALDQANEVAMKARLRCQRILRHLLPRALCTYFFPECCEQAFRHVVQRCA